MRAKKYGGPQFLRNTLTRRHLFWNSEKSLSLDEVVEMGGGKFLGKWWEVHRVELSENRLDIVRTLVCATPSYAVAWNLVKREEVRT